MKRLTVRRIVRKSVEGRGRGLFEELFHNLLGREEQNV